MSAPAGTLLDRYRRIRLLGSGGFGAVYLAEDLRLGRTVAMKEMDADRLGADERAVAEAMFEREARMLASLDHPGLTRVWDFFQIERRAFLVMEYVPGHTLRDELNQRGGPLDEPFVVECALQLCDVLQYLHTRSPQVIFRDLKPANVMLLPGDDAGEAGDNNASPPQIRLIDFGIARLFKPDQSGDTLIIGTPGFAPPEQYGQGQTDPRSDIYSLGVTLHQLLSGQAPASVPPPPLATLNPAVSPELARIVTRATALEPAERYPSADALRRDLLPLRRASALAPAPQPPIVLSTRPAAPAPSLGSSAAPRVTTPLPLSNTTPRPPRQSSPALTLILVVVLLGIVALGTLGLRAFGRLSGEAGGAAGVAATAPPAAQEWLLPGASGKIAFGQLGAAGGFDVWITGLDGQPPKQITNDRASFSPAWSPDGTRLSVTHDKDIYVGTASSPLAKRVELGNLEGRYPAWSPDGRRLALAARSDGGAWRLAIADLDSGEVSFPPAPENIGGLAWAPGQRLVFAAQAGPGQPQDIFVLDANGAAVNITNTPSSEEDLPAWSPDGRRLAFTSSPAGRDKLDQRQIVVMNSDGSGRTELTGGDGPHTNAVWSPDGSWLAYLAKENSTDWQVWAMRADGSAPRVLTFGPQRKFYLSWGK